MPKKTPPTSLKVLFIGNSFTARNNVPALVASIAKANDQHFEHQLLSIGGASLRTHWNKGEAVKAIRDGGFDVVVLQEQSTLPIKNASRMHENLRLFNAVVQQSGATTALYETWARKHVPQTQDVINSAYRTIAEELNATLLPAGEAWQRFLVKHDDPILHDRDGSHPTLAGSFLAASVIYRVLFQMKKWKDPPIEGLAARDIKKLHAAASG